MTAIRPAGCPPRTIPARFRDAFRGVLIAYRQEPNLRLHAVAACAVLVLALALRVDRAQGLYLFGTGALVLMAELFNTAIERTVDLAADTRAHPLARQAKDVAAGAVLVAVVHAVIAGWYIFVLPRGITNLVQSIYLWPHHSPAAAAGGLILLLAAALTGLLLPRSLR